MSIVTRAALLLPCWLALPCLAQTAFTYLADGRRCSVFFSGDGSGSSFEVPQTPFAPYQGGANIEADNGFEFWQAACTQDSTCDPRSMTMNGAGSGHVSGNIGNTLNAQGTSQFDIRFSCAADTPYTLVGYVAEAGHSSSIAEIRLSTAAGVVIHQITSTADSTTPVSLEGMLPAGTYVLFARAMGRAIGFPGQTQTGEAACVFSLSAPAASVCNLDWNGDSVVDSSDFLAFVADFLAGEGDYNQDGVSSSADFFEFLQDFLGGC